MAQVTSASSSMVSSPWAQLTTSAAHVITHSAASGDLLLLLLLPLPWLLLSAFSYFLCVL